MIVEQIYTGCLAEAAYYIESNGVAAIIDPLRETSPYIKRAEKNGARIQFVFETHFHADFVSGHLELAQKTGAQIVYGPNAHCGFDCHTAKDGEEFKIGALTLRVIHTPGHTLESTTYLLLDETGKEHCIFTGDTLFIGDVGRPDLAIENGLTKNDLAGMLFDSLNNKIKTLPDHVIVYPAHGAGSACGKNMSKETFDTLGNQKQMNYALKQTSREAFIKEVSCGLMPAPQYFAKNARLNQQGAQDLEKVFSNGLKAMSAEEFEAAQVATEALILDTRDAQTFCKAFVPGSINIGLGGQFAPWVGNLITDLQQPILLICEAGREEEAVMRLARVGYDNTLGFLQGGIEAWANEGRATDSVTSISADEFANRYAQQNIHVVDVRKPGEYENEHVKNAELKPLDFINEWNATLDRTEPHYIHCAGGYRSMIAASILKARGYNNLIEVAGGYSAISKTTISKEKAADTVTA